MQAARARRAVERARLSEHGIAIDVGPGAHRFVALADVLEAGRGERLDGDLAGFDPARRLRGAEFI